MEWRTGTFTATLTNNVPDGLPDYMTGRIDQLQLGVNAADIVTGSNRDFVVVYAPMYATLESATLDGESVSVQEGELAGRPAVTIDVETMPGQTRTIEVTWSEPAVSTTGATLATTPQVVLPPLANPATVSLHEGGKCE